MGKDDMKVNIKTLFQIILLLMLISGCDILENNNTMNIGGEWIIDRQIEEEENLSQRLEYKYNLDNTYYV